MEPTDIKALRARIGRAARRASKNPDAVAELNAAREAYALAKGRDVIRTNLAGLHLSRAARGELAAEVMTAGLDA